MERAWTDALLLTLLHDSNLLINHTAPYGESTEEAIVPREDTINELKHLLRELEDRKREIDTQYSAVATTIQLLNGDSIPSTGTTSPGSQVELDTVATGDEDNKVPW